MPVRRRIPRSPRLRHQVQRHELTRRRWPSARTAATAPSRCGSTEVNHDPGPNTTQSASRTAVDRLGHGRRVGGQQRDRPHPARRDRDRGLPAHRGDARRARPGRARPRRRRCPAAPPPSAAPARSPAAAGRPSPGPRPGRRAGPTARRSAGCPGSGRPGRRRRRSGAARPGPRSCPSSSSPHSAARAIRRSPGGSTPNSSRSRPDEPPLSATVTIAVTSSVTRRSADSDAARPCPPPKRDHPRRAARESAATRTSLPPEVAVRHA